MLRAVESTSNITYTKINAILLAKETILNHIISENKKIRKPEELVEMIFTQPITKVKHLTNAKIYSTITARDTLNKLSEMHVLERKTMEGHHYYLNHELYRILSD
jgi:chorismate mutase